ncbi:hypothetical protein ACFFWC_29370 [Plantactinospora siamensis]|uniref:Recombinase A n=1 Tax=Plantactinospora siamensis TaxID=555372 RepID=A0ABV6P1Q0_9ACTN
MAGRMVVGSAALAGLVRPASEPAPGGHRVLPVLPELTGLLPGRGLRRGSTVAVTGRPVPGGAPLGRPAGGGVESALPAGGGMSLLLSLLAQASRNGSWCAVVGLPTLGVVAAADLGIALDRLALVPDPGPEWATVVAALIDGVDVVVAAVPASVSASVTGRLAARARQRGSVLVPFGRWDGADLTLQVLRGAWEGLGQGRGRLRRREVTIRARGRGAAARPKEITVWMPGDGSTATIRRPAGAPPARPGTAPPDPAVTPTPPPTPGPADAPPARSRRPAPVTLVSAAS